MSWKCRLGFCGLGWNFSRVVRFECEGVEYIAHRCETCGTIRHATPALVKEDEER